MSTQAHHVPYNSGYVTQIAALQKHTQALLGMETRSVGPTALPRHLPLALCHSRPTCWVTWTRVFSVALQETLPASAFCATYWQLNTASNVLQKQNSHPAAMLFQS
jgi:hypothetical protein